MSKSITCATGVVDGSLYIIGPFLQFYGDEKQELDTRSVNSAQN